LLLSILGRKVANDDPAANPFADFSYAVSSNLSSVPEARICGRYDDIAAAIPIVAADYSKTTYASASTLLMGLRGIFPAVQPECIQMQGASSGGSTVTSQSLATPTGLSAPIPGDLQILVLTTFGTSSVTITPPAGFSLVVKFGNRLAVYKRVLTGSESYPDTTTFSSAVSVMSHLYTFPLDSYDAAAEVLSATASGSGATSIETPSRTADSTWNGKTNYSMRFIVRNGVGGTTSNTVSVFPAALPEIRRSGFNQGSTTERVSFGVAGGPVVGNVAAAETFTFAGSASGSSWEAVTIFIKGI
jgi:hypothetical protein